MYSSTEQVYPPRSDAIRSARWFCVDYLHGVLTGTDSDIDATVDDARLIVSELVTNAMQAHPSEIRLRVSYNDEYVRITVSDTAPGIPTQQHPAPTSEHGRGLRIVDQLAKRWGTAELAEGKQVWAEIALTPDTRPLHH
jgi:signal transduction histidine kinase